MERKPMTNLNKISWILLGVAVVMTLIGTVYVFRTPPAENKHPTLLLTAGVIVLALVFISFVLDDLSKGEKTVKEAVITVTVEMAMLGLYILVANLLRK
jgi:O-antigen/teichoic acid export membrane protein